MVAFTHVDDIVSASLEGHTVEDAWEEAANRDPSSVASEAETAGELAPQLRGTQIAPQDITWFERIGNGAMCEVFRVQFCSCSAAGKKLFEKFSDDPMSKPFQDMVDEVNFVAELGSHPNVCEFYGFSLGPNDSPVLLMELIQGPTLEDHFQEYRTKRKKWAAKLATMYKWISDILSALAFLHDRPIPLLHRDFKPANLVLNADRSNLKLIDFGVSRQLSARPQAEDDKEEQAFESLPSLSRSTASTSSARMRRSMTARTGTSRYMSPEVFDSSTCFYDEKADLFSAALVMWEICAGGKKAFNGKHDADLLAQQSFRDYARPEITDVKWREVHAIIEAAWAKDPQERPPAQQLLADLRQLPGCPPEGDPSPLAPSGGCMPQGCSVQ